MTLCACWVVVYDVDHDVIDVTVDNDVSGVERNGDVADGSLVSLDHSYAAALSKGYFETDHSNIVAPDHSYHASSPRTMKTKMDPGSAESMPYKGEDAVAGDQPIE